MILLAILIPVTLGYGVTGLALALFAAGAAAGFIARGGAGMGFGAGARAGAIFMLFLLTSWALVQFQAQDPSGILSSPWILPFVPYIAGMSDMWDTLFTLTQPLLGGLSATVGGGLFVDLILQIIFPALVAAAGGIVGGSIAGAPKRAPMPTPANPYPTAVPQAYPGGDPYASGNPYPAAGSAAYLCPWCNLKVLPHMEMCWNCGGPLQMPPPPAQ